MDRRMNILEREVEDLANSLPWEQSQLWAGIIFMLGAIALALWLLNRNDGTSNQLPTLLEVEAKWNPNQKRINPWLALGEFYAVVLLANWLSQWGMGLGLLVYLLGSGLILWQTWRVYYR